MEKIRLINELRRWPAEKLPPCSIYSELVKLTGLHNGWNCGQWVKYLQNEFKQIFLVDKLKRIGYNKVIKLIKEGSQK